ncbi:hypothetical protein UAW_00710 [Enterococcus haemoperoxidus ATCC BAA-382]|uniref:Cell wall elongation regulator TseB-like domain-containing protein n=1 Tax=Enterococcus haemoperoxidus ATCC BAA-382 TaxID=1158608 RepID=R2QW00_9ENTE|nr:DUF5590 domain-containing protein [Enterococcus haemoperoxidus]EOH99558.1 hypothetical protein UAW_00710 [Enterococcus haemoperoxidus ATCC BAA-382]EOT62702.1 hypothetical protein I583_01703 [Enterococcus haemoperoxidus ATCC BAA-382]OJG55169.1 hypothetical protein RV06_GL002206 [Enterococcus haemoperoxidus]
MQEQEDQNEARKTKILVSVIAVLLVIIVMITISYIRSTHPRTQAKKEATAIAKKYAHLETVDNFYWFTRKDTYFSVTGKDDKGENLAVIIPKSGDKVTVLNQKDGVEEGHIRQIMETDYKEKRIQKISLGLYKDKPTWEVVTKNEDGSLNYYLLSFEKAEEIMIIKNV